MTLEKVFAVGHCGAWRNSAGTILDVVPDEERGGFELIYGNKQDEYGVRDPGGYAIDHFESLDEIAEKWPQDDWQPSLDCECPLCDKLKEDR